MAGEAEELGPFKPWSRLRASAVSTLLTQKRPIVVGLPAFFLVLTFLLYWFLGPRETPYIQHINQANAFLHGRLDIVPEFSKNINLIERACSEFVNGACAQNAKLYITHPPMPALILLPGVALFGIGVNATLVSAVIGALNAPLVLGIVRKFTENITAQVWLTVLFLFGTMFWFTASNGSVWFFSHTVATLFLLLAIYTTLVRKDALLTGIFLGAAFLSRQSAIMGLPFFLIMYADQWLPESKEKSLLRRFRLKPLIQLGAGLSAFVLFAFVFNYLRFDNPLDAGYFHSEQVKQPRWAYVYNHGPFHASYIRRHIPVILEGLPIFRSEGPYVLPSWAGMAIWGTTPAFFYALFTNIRNKWVMTIGAAALFAAVAILISRGVARVWDLGWATFDFPFDVNLFPFYAMIALAIATGFKDKLVIACWAAIIPITMTNFTFAATGWAQFGYRYALDFYPFLFLLTIRGVGSDIKWHHKSLIVLSIMVNLWAVLWIYQFEPRQLFDWHWVSFY